jgi:asparagine synthase (glutamine-hydrolysing)
MSYPEGDTGREDELIQAVADFHRSQVEWIRIGDVPEHDPMARWAERRDEAFAHHYEPWNRALAQGTRRTGARIALSGTGGDQFFSVSPVYLSDLLRSGRWFTLAREARSLGFRMRGFRELVHWAIQPVLPAVLHRAIGAARGGRPLRPHLQLVFPEWIRPDRSLIEGLRARQWHYHHRRSGETMSSAESNWYLNTTFGPRVSSLVSTIALGEGVEVRSPLFDPRVLAFLAGRPRHDRFALGENKLLLRAAVTGLLPAAHLARRTRRTGLPGGYLVRALPASLGLGWEGVRGDLRLAALGIVDPGALERAFERYFRSPQRQSDMGAQLFEILAVEYWLRARGKLGFATDFQ